ncbi:amidohydrolase family protein, partial [Klebsiella pneumoniae]
GLDAGTLKPGARADMTIVDLDEPWIGKEEQLRSRSKNSCFERARFQGRVLQTFVAGKSVFTI